MTRRPEITICEKRCCVVLRRTPTLRDVDHIIDTILATRGVIVVVVEYSDTAITSYPTLELIWHVWSHLTHHHEVVTSRLLGTAIVVTLDPLLSVVKDLALSILQPRKPFCISDDTNEIDSFVSACLRNV